jgi:hypothetical protein
LVEEAARYFLNPFPFNPFSLPDLWVHYSLKSKFQACENFGSKNDGCLCQNFNQPIDCSLLTFSR